MPQHTPLELSRRNFLGRAGAVVAGLSALNASALALAGCSSEATPAAPQAASEAPKVLTWNTVITAKDEPGRPLLVSGRIYGPDGKTPLEGVTLYVYHTDNTGLYPGDGINPAPRLRGWMKTDREGRYEFRTIKPASYPNSSNPEHVHTKASGPGFAERWLDNFWFEDDPLIPSDMRAKFDGQGAFSPVMAVKRDADGLLRCVRDIRLARA
ncbi:MAG TPA: hypothetical protein VE360_01825 [Pyrinomonadaceae bacterium]|jgi:protocatechuate 3,4-dioxygenase beta subunit|nr:hypothetical protein [Pyrinomonadaceae bacterium]